MELLVPGTSIRESIVPIRAGDDMQYLFKPLYVAVIFSGSSDNVHKVVVVQFNSTFSYCCRRNVHRSEEQLAYAVLHLPSPNTRVWGICLWY